MRSLPPRHTARAWDCGSAAPLLNRTGAACGLPTILRVGQDFVSHYALKPRHATEVCQEIAPVHTAKPNAKAARTAAPIRNGLHRLANPACKPPDVVSPAQKSPQWHDKWSQPRFYLGPRCRRSPSPTHGPVRETRTYIVYNPLELGVQLVFVTHKPANAERRYV